MHQMTCLSPGLSVLSYLLHLIPTDASFLKSLLMTLHQFCHRRPGLLQNLSDSNCCAWLGIHGSPSMRHVQVNSVTGIWWLLPTCIVQMSLSLSCSTLCPFQNPSLPSVVHCFEQFYLNDFRLATFLGCTARLRGLMLHITLFSLISYFSCFSIFLDNFANIPTADALTVNGSS